MHHHQIDWGDAAGWITGVSTVLLAAVTAWGLRVQSSEIKRQRKDLTDQQEQIDEQRRLTQRQTAWIEAQLSSHRRAQARQIAVTLESATMALPDAPERNLLYIRAYNGSDRPVFAVDCRALDGPDVFTPPVLCGHVNPQADAFHNPIFGVEGGLPYLVLGPGEKIDFPFDRQPAPRARAQFAMRFHDDEGVQWERDVQHHLTEVNEDSAEWSA